MMILHTFDTLFKVIAILSGDIADKTNIMSP